MSKRTPKTCDDCEVTWDRKHNLKDIVLCPKHRATDDLLAVLKRGVAYMAVTSPTIRRPPWVFDAAAAIAEAEKGR